MEKQPRATLPGIYFLQERGALFTQFIRARYWNAGHLLGSASFEIEFAGEVLSGQPLRILASGDIGPDAKLLQPNPEAPTGFDYLISETTSGNTDRPPTTSQERRQRLGNARSRRLGRHQDPSNDHRSTGSRPGRCSPSIVFGRCNEGHLCCTTWPVIACS